MIKKTNKNKTQNYLIDDDPHPLSFFRAKRGENFLCDSNTRAFRAEGAERIFFQKLDPETAKNSLCEIAFFFTKLSIFWPEAEKLNVE